MARRLLVDTDGGTDDALALALLVALGRAPAFVTTSFGNVALDQATDNILATLAILGCDAPVHAGAARPLIGAAIDAADVHGEDGLGGAPRPAKQADVASRNGVDFLRTVLREAAESEEPIDILALGPLTNLALAFAAEPAIAAGVGELVIMGGTVFGRGNVTGAAEFNILADPEAAAMVLALPLPTVMVPWEPCVEAALAGDLAMVERALAFTAAFPGAVLSLGSATVMSPGPREEKFAAAARFYNAAGEAGRRHGVTVAFHPSSHHDTLLETRADYDRIMELTDPALIGWVPDTGHILRGRQDILDTLESYSDRIRYLHLKDVDAAGRWAMLGAGACDIPAVIATVAKAPNFNGWLVVEEESEEAGRDPAAAVARNRRMLKDVVGV